MTMDDARRHLKNGLDDLEQADDAVHQPYNSRQMKYASAQAHLTAGLLLVFTRIMEVDAAKPNVAHNLYDRSCTWRASPDRPASRGARCLICNPLPPSPPPF